MRGTTKKQIHQKGKEEYELNKGIEIMLPRSRRIPLPSTVDRSFRFFKWSVRVRLDINEDTNGN